MTAPVQGFTGDAVVGLNGPTRIDVELMGDFIEVTLTPSDATGLAIRDRRVTLTHDEARQIIAGLASVIE